MITFGDLRTWDAAAVGGAGDLLRGDLDKLERARDALRDRAVPATWLGLARMAARGQQALLVGMMDRHLDVAGGFVRAIYQAEGLVTQVSETVVHIANDAAAQEFRIGGDGTVTDVSDPGMFHSETAASAYTEERTRLRDALVARVEAVLETAYDVDTVLVNAFPDNELGTEGPGGPVDPRVARAWEGMSEDERRAVLTHIAEQLAEDYGFEVDVVIEDLEDRDGDGRDDDPGLDYHGFYRDSDRSLHLDTNELGDPDTIDTVAHEIRHGLQHEMVRDNNPSAWDRALIAAGVKDDPWNPPDGITRDDAEEWEENFDHYVDAGTDYDGYRSQPVETDAREAGDTYLEDLTPEELAEIREEAS